VGPEQKALVGVQGAKPLEADEFLRAKGVFSLSYDNEHIRKYVIRKYVKKNFKERTLGAPALNPPLMVTSTQHYGNGGELFSAESY
jgi:hypothetical protein